MLAQLIQNINFSQELNNEIFDLGIFVQCIKVDSQIKRHDKSVVDVTYIIVSTNVVCVWIIIYFNLWYSIISIIIMNFLNIYFCYFLWDWES